MGRARTGRMETDRLTLRVKIALEADVYWRLCRLADRNSSTLSEVGAHLIKLGLRHLEITRLDH